MHRDRHAAARIRELRMEAGWTPERLSYEVSKAAPQTPVSGRTIRRIEATGAVPTVRVMFGISKALDLSVTELWAVRSRVAA